jgi:hypothetical protein
VNNQPTPTGDTKEKKQMQHETSATHRTNLKAGLKVAWYRFTGNTDADWSVVCYSDKSRWLFDNASAEKLTLLGEVADGLNKAEILETDNGAIIALYSAEPKQFSNRESWLDSLGNFDREQAENLLSNW